MPEQQTNTVSSASYQPDWIRREFFPPFAFYRESIHCLDGALSEKKLFVLWQMRGTTTTTIHRLIHFIFCEFIREPKEKGEDYCVVCAYERTLTVLRLIHNPTISFNQLIDSISGDWVRCEIKENREWIRDKGTDANVQSIPKPIFEKLICKCLLIVFNFCRFAISLCSFLSLRFSIRKQQNLSGSKFKKKINFNDF